MINSYLKTTSLPIVFTDNILRSMRNIINNFKISDERPI